MTSITKPTVSPNVSDIVDTTKVATAASVKTPINDLALATMVAQQYVSVSANDDNIKHLDDALTVSGGGITKTIIDPGDDESINFEVDNTDAIWNAAQLQGRTISSNSPAVGNALVWNGSLWVPSAVAAGSSSTVYTAQGRLTLDASYPVSAADVSAATSLKYVPFTGNHLALYTAAGLELVEITSGVLILNNSISLSGLTADKNYDVYAYKHSSGYVALELVAWTNDTTRATALNELQRNLFYKTGDSTRRYMGTIRITATTGQCEDSELRRYVYNHYNKVPRRLKVADTTSSWTYDQTTMRSANNSASNRVGFVVGVQADFVRLRAQLAYTSGGTGIKVGIGLDSTSTGSEDLKGAAVTGGDYAEAEYYGAPAAGYHYLQVLEGCRSAATTTLGGMASVGHVMA